MLESTLIQTPIRTTCPYCGVGCGVIATSEGRIAGDPQHPANAGRLCSKGSALGETLNLPDRLLYPEVDGKRASWDAALDALAEGFRRALQTHGPDGVALYVSGQLLTEDYYAANKLAKGFLGTGNIDSNSRLCMASAVSGHRRAFGEDIVPGIYADLEQADLVTLVGSNLAWCHPVLFQRLMVAKAARPSMRIVVVDPRRTATCEGADLHLPLKPGSDVALFLALLNYCAEHGFSSYSASFQEVLSIAKDTVKAVPGITGLAPETIATFCHWFAETPRSVTLFSQGANQSSAGTDKANAIINCHLLTGRIGTEGAGPFSITGQPNAMGGREVGALATTLAGHLDWAYPAEVAALREFWRAPHLAKGVGLKAVDLFQAAGEGRIGALWIMATNPAISLPDSTKARAALARVPMLAVSDCVANTDTMAFARIRLPVLGWGEKDGTVTNSERVISRQRRFLPRPGEAKPDWWVVAQLAKRLGWGESFAWKNPADIFREHAALTGLVKRADRIFDISGLAGLSDSQYEEFAPRQWPIPTAGPQGGRIIPPHQRFLPTAFRAPTHGLTKDAPFTLLTGRVRDQWHTMTRTGPVPRLMEHTPEPLLSMHPDDAIHLPEGALARVISAWGTSILRIIHDTGMARGTVFVPMHWTTLLAPAARINAAVNPATDPVSGQPELKHTPVRIEAFPVGWQGFVLTRRSLDLEAMAWSARIPCESGIQRFELAGQGVPAEIFERLRNSLTEAASHWVILEDASLGIYRAALLQNGRLLAVIMLGPDQKLPPREWLLGLMATPQITLAERRALLAGQPADGPPPSPTLCICHGVRAATVTAAVAAGCKSVAAIGEATKAGSGCGSCRPEIAVLLSRVMEPG